jgi:hypothetical protein
MADVTITIPDAQVPRVLDSIGRLTGLVDEFGNPRPATGAEAKTFVAETLKGLIFKEERVDTGTAAADTVDKIDIT